MFLVVFRDEDLVAELLLCCTMTICSAEADEVAAAAAYGVCKSIVISRRSELVIVESVL